MKYGEVIADRLSKAGWSFGWVSAIDSQGRTIWIVDANRGDGKHFVVRADEKLSAFVKRPTGWPSRPNRKHSSLFEIALLLVRLDPLARFIVNANHGIV